jgi:hypothetical protein
MENIFGNYEEYMNKHRYNEVLNQLTRKFWSDFDYHRERMIGVFNRIAKISWIDIDNNLYNKILIKRYEFGLLLSRYSHYSYDKCFPNSEECHECFKYWCACCDKGTNSMYSSCNGKRCIMYLKTIPNLFINTNKRMYVYDNKENNFFLMERKKILRDRETYGY